MFIIIPLNELCINFKTNFFFSRRNAAFIAYGVCYHMTSLIIMVIIVCIYINVSKYVYRFYLSAGLKRCMTGGAVGFGIAAVYCLVTSKDHIKRMIGLRD